MNVFDVNFIRNKHKNWSIYPSVVEIIKGMSVQLVTFRIPVKKLKINPTAILENVMFIVIVMFIAINLMVTFGTTDMYC